MEDTATTSTEVRVPNFSDNLGDGRPLLVTVDEVAEMLNLSRSKTYEMVASGQLPSVRFGRAVRVPLRALISQIDGMTTRTRN
jgi:excisionase family DNA binding protein